MCSLFRPVLVPRGVSSSIPDRAQGKHRTVVSSQNARSSVSVVSLAGNVVTHTHMHVMTRRGDCTVTHARKGLLAETLDGEESARKKKMDKKAKQAGGGGDSMAGSLEPQFAGQQQKTPAAGKNWIVVGNVNEDFKEKPIKPLVLANGNFCLVKWEDLVFVTDCNSTAFSYPLIDGELFFGPAGPAIRVPLDGTEYDLTTGQVITWCPKDSLVRSALGALKATVDPIPLPVYPARVERDGSVMTNFVDKIDTKGGFVGNDTAGSIPGGKGVEIAMKTTEAGVSVATPANGSSSSSDASSPVSPAVAVGLLLVAAAGAFLVLSPSQ
jgi:nitrite reductase/ring-hydroxylating ferredoxin subunit